MLWRQGDLFIAPAGSVPKGSVQRASGVLLEGEITGHSHRIDDAKSAVVHEWLGELFIEVLGQRAAVVHQEHGTVLLPHGIYRTWRQREFDPPPDKPGVPVSKRNLPIRFVQD